MKYAVIKLVDNPYIYDNEASIVRCFNTEDAAADFIEHILIPDTEKLYAKEFGTLNGYQIQTIKKDSEWEVTASYSRKLDGVEIAPDWLETTSYAIKLACAF